MRNVLAAAILALPIFAPAQALHTGISHLVASVDAPAFAFQAGAITAAAPRVFSGLIAPIRLTALNVASVGTANTGVVTVEYTVNKAGVPQNVRAVSAPTKDMGDRVVAAVQNVRYTPGKLDGQLVDVPVRLNVEVK